MIWTDLDCVYSLFSRGIHQILNMVPFILFTTGTWRHGRIIPIRNLLLKPYFSNTGLWENQWEKPTYQTFSSWDHHLQWDDPSDIYPDPKKYPDAGRFQRRTDGPFPGSGALRSSSILLNCAKPARSITDISGWFIVVNHQVGLWFI